MNEEKIDAAITSMKSLSYYEWKKVEREINELFDKKIGEAKKGLRITKDDLEKLSHRESE